MFPRSNCSWIRIHDAMDRFPWYVIACLLEWLFLKPLSATRTSFLVPNLLVSWASTGWFWRRTGEARLDTQYLTKGRAAQEHEPKSSYSECSSNTENLMLAMLRTKETESTEQNAGYPAKGTHSKHRIPNEMKCVTRKRFYCLEAMSKTGWVHSPEHSPAWCMKWLTFMPALPALP